MAGSPSWSATAVTVAVVIPCRNESAHLYGLLDALASQTRPPDELVVVDDRSTDGTAEVAQAWKTAHPHMQVRLVEGAGRGPAPAMNAGISATAADIVMRMDGHARPAGDYLARCLDLLADPAVGVAGGVWDVAPGADTSTARAIAAVVSHPLGSGGALYRHADASGPERSAVDTVPFGTFKRQVWEHLGGFDESLAVNEDFDFNYRVRQRGLVVMFDRRIRATYLSRATLSALMRQYLRYGFWKVRMLRKDPRAVRGRQVPPAAVMPWVVVSLLIAVVFPGAVTLGAAAAYPALVGAGAIHIAVTRRVAPAAAAVALAAVHLSWSTGFWRALLGGSAPR